MTSQKRRMTLQEIYAEIPETKCQPGCHACCGVVPFAVLELEACGLSEPPPVVVPCPLLGPSGCTVYSTRPFMCRIFGASHAEGLKCPKADIDDHKRLGIKQTRELTREYQKFAQAVDPLDLLEQAMTMRKSKS